MPRFGLRIRNDNILLQSGSTNRVLGAMAIKICDMQGLEVGQRPRLRGGFFCFPSRWDKVYAVGSTIGRHD